MPPTSAIPGFYWVVFGWYEPLLTLLGFIGAILYPKEAHDQQAPWQTEQSTANTLPLPTLITTMQLASVVGLLGLINCFVLWTARRYLFGQPAIQEKVVSALLTPLLIGDILHLSVTLWALGDDRWNIRAWRNSGTLWVTISTGISLLVPRIAWHLGIGRYVDSRDRQTDRQRK
ncbi:unnamed protein product [Somion occarium]|uniref:DUF7704 domain-containing protein n=1 Tax=Somion occarium TaxID=3059160 RepID=A0ABP1D1D3_9APHY